jgi:hypothetical protein
LRRRVAQAKDTKQRRLRSVQTRRNANTTTATVTNDKKAAIQTKKSEQASASAPVAVPVSKKQTPSTVTFRALRDVRRLKPIVDGPVDPADSRALKALLRELRPAQLLGQRRLRDALSEELARQPARPHRNAPAKEWRLYAQALERINAAYSVLKRFVGA